MPEGPSIILVKEAAAKFAGKKIIAVSGKKKSVYDAIHPSLKKSDIH